jgi:hypothetical protein
VLLAEVDRVRDKRVDPQITPITQMKVKPCPGPPKYQAIGIELGSVAFHLPAKGDPRLKLVTAPLDRARDTSS